LKSTIISVVKMSKLRVNKRFFISVIGKQLLVISKIRITLNFMNSILNSVLNLNASHQLPINTCVQLVTGN